MVPIKNQKIKSFGEKNYGTLSWQLKFKGTRT